MQKNRQESANHIHLENGH